MASAEFRVSRNLTPESYGLTEKDLRRKEITGESVDELLYHGIRHIQEHGEPIDVTAGTGIQAYGVSYTLLDSRSRVQTTRFPIAGQYLAAELLAFFGGGLHVDEGLEAVSKFWAEKADSNGNIQSNYGHYVFRQPIRDLDGETIRDENGSQLTQYDWVIRNLDRNLQSRKGFINLNQPCHKKPGTQDFPCVAGAHFFTRRSANGTPVLMSEVSSRSTDAITGLPYNIAFFAFLNELVAADLTQRGHTLLLGPTRVNSSLTQLYDRTRGRANDIVTDYEQRGVLTDKAQMPPITDARATLDDIYNGTATTDVFRWIHEQTREYGREVVNGIPVRIPHS